MRNNKKPKTPKSVKTYTFKEPRKEQGLKKEEICTHCKRFIKVSNPIRDEKGNTYHPGCWEGMERCQWQPNHPYRNGPG